MRSSYHSKSFAFTINYGEDQEGDIVKQIKNLVAREEFEFLVAGLERDIPPKVNDTYKVMHKFEKPLLPAGAHIEKALRDRYANYKYCTKEGNVIAIKGFEKKNEQEKTRKVKQAKQILTDIKEITEGQFVFKHHDFHLQQY